MIQAYKVDKVVYVINTWQLKKEQVHLTEVRQTKQEHPCNALMRRRERKRMIPNDQRAEFGPPDKRTHLSDYTLESTATKPMKPKAVEVDDCVVKTLINQHPETMGKRVRVKYDIADNGDTEWFEGINNNI